jgi:hypothetical protein
MVFLSDLVLNIGTAFIGSSVIAMSFIVFAMQINIERLPYKLFCHFSKDKKFFRTFIALLYATIFLSVLSIFLDHASKIFIIIFLVVIVICIICIPFFFWHLYLRSLDLINPIKQLNILESAQDAKIQEWANCISQKMDLFNKSTEISSKDYMISVMGEYVDFISSIVQMVEGLIALAKHNARHGDYDLVSKALAVIVKINSSYLQIKNNLCHKYHCSDLMQMEGKGIFFYIRNAIDQYTEEAIADNSSKAEIVPLLSSLAELMKACSIIEPFKYRRNYIFLLYGDFDRAVKALENKGRWDLVGESQNFLGEAVKIFTQMECFFQTLIACQSMVSVAERARKNQRPIVVWYVLVELSSIMTVLLKYQGQIDENDHDKAYSVVIIDTGMLIDKLATLLLDEESSLLFFPLTSDSTLKPLYYCIDSTNPNCFIGTLHNIAKMFCASENQKQSSLFERNITLFAHSLTQSNAFLKKAIQYPRHVLLKTYLAHEIIQWILTVVTILFNVYQKSTYQPRIDVLKKASMLLLSLLEALPDNEDTNTNCFNETLSGLLFNLIHQAKQYQDQNILRILEKIFLDWTFRDKGFEENKKWLIGLAAIFFDANSVSLQNLKNRCLENQDLSLKDAAEKLQESINNGSLDDIKSVYVEKYSISEEKLNACFVEIITVLSRQNS